MVPTIRILFLMLVVVVLPSCSTPDSSQAQTPTSLAFSLPETTLIAEPEPIELSDAETTLVNFHAGWVCEFQRRTFNDPSDGPRALEEALESAEITEIAYRTFLEELDNSQDLRDLVLFIYQESCRG
jgi:hypothetical protein